jgi:hypothetical protein
MMRPAPLLKIFEPHRRFPRRRRTVTLGRNTALLVGFAFLILFGWSGATLWYFTSRHEVALRLLEKQAGLKRSYEERISAMRATLDEVAGQGQSARVDVEAQLKGLLARQASLEKRASLVQTIAERAGVEVISLAEPVATGSTPSALGTGVTAYAPSPAPEQAEPFQLRLRPVEPNPDLSSNQVHGVLEGLERAKRTLAELETRQLRSLESVMRKADVQATQLHAAIRTAGLNPGRLNPTGPGGAGGPLVADTKSQPAIRTAALDPGPLTPTLPGGAGDPLPGAKGKEGLFENLAVRAEASVLRLERLRRSVSGLPFAEPIHGGPDLSSGFGYRLDPFTRNPALHTGLDFRAEYGALVRATGSGRVITAEYSGAYGNMVEIEHSNGVTTRYGHLSTIGVLVGQPVAPGTILGRVGSTGRSTGPHLHYETRIDGEAVDPQRFLRAAAQMADLELAMR